MFLELHLSANKVDSPLPWSEVGTRCVGVVVYAAGRAFIPPWFVRILGRTHRSCLRGFCGSALRFNGLWASVRWTSHARVRRCRIILAIE